MRTIVELETGDGLVGVGELGGGGQSAETAIEALRPYVIGHDPFAFEALHAKLLNPTGGLYNNRAQLHAALEFACLDLVGKWLEVPAYDLLGGKLRDRVPFASYLFFRYANSAGGGEVRTVEQLVAHALALRELHGFAVHKLKGGVFPPRYEIECYKALAGALGEDRLRYDPNASLSIEDALWVTRAISSLPNDYLEDPTWGLEGLRQVRTPGLLIATNTVVVNFEQLASNVLRRCVDVILLDTTFWGGLRACVKAAGVCETFQIPVSVHSSGELGVQLATMLHLAAVLPGLTFAADAHYHHLVDDVIEGGKLAFSDGTLTVPDAPGLGVTLDRKRVEHYAEEFRRLGSYPYDRDPGRPGWYASVPNREWADPDDGSAPFRENDL